MINLRLFRLVFFLLNYGKWKLLGLKSKKFINIKLIQSYISLNL